MFHVAGFPEIRGSYASRAITTSATTRISPNIGASNYVLEWRSGAGGRRSRTLGNNDLAWERNKQWDIGVDITLLNNRLSFTYDYYHRITDGLIQARPIPRASGYTTITSNVGALAFWDMEFSVN